MEIFLYLFLLFYFLYTLSFALKFNKTDIFYSKKQRLVHNIMIWVVPFFWIMILKTIEKPIPSRNGYKKQIETSNDGTDVGWWAFGFYSFFHGSGYSSREGHSEHDSGGYDSHGGYDYGGGADSTGFGDGDGGGGGD